MKRTNGSFLLAYLLLVVLPLLGLTGVLKQGHKLTAPIAVGGLWKMQVDGGNVATLPCGKSLLASGDSSFVISQSGKTFTLNFINSAMFSISGTVEGTTIKANVSPSPALAKEAGCGAERVFSLTATANSEANVSSLAGALSVSDCQACAPVEFRAFRENLSKAKGDR